MRVWCRSIERLGLVAILVEAGGRHRRLNVASSPVRGRRFSPRDRRFSSGLFLLPVRVCAVATVRACARHDQSTGSFLTARRSVAPPLADLLSADVLGAPTVRRTRTQQGHLSRCSLLHKNSLYVPGNTTASPWPISMILVASFSTKYRSCETKISVPP